MTKAGYAFFDHPIKLKSMRKDPKSPEDIEKIKRVLYLLYNSGYSLNFFERTPRKELSLFKIKLEVIKSEKPFIVFRKAKRTKGMTDVFLCLHIMYAGELANTVSNARISDEEAVKFEVEIKKQGYVAATDRRNNEKWRKYELPA